MPQPYTILDIIRELNGPPVAECPHPSGKRANDCEFPTKRTVVCPICCVCNACIAGRWDILETKLMIEVNAERAQGACEPPDRVFPNADNE